MGGIIGFLSRAGPRAAPGARFDAIFVFAGGQARKELGAAAWRRGDAPVLVVSVARFEWRRYALLGLPGFEALRAAVDRVPPPKRHFYVVLERGAASASTKPPRDFDAPAERVTILSVAVHRFGTRNEARALFALARERGWASILAISSEFHLRRVALVLERSFQGSGTALAYAAPAPGADPHGPGRWWRTRRGIKLVLGEVV
jgi:uncharacterized SAM-binding protein YcdF (DUF218 family)